MAERLQITALDLQDGTRVRDVVAMAVVAAVTEQNFEAGPKLDREIDIIHSDLLGALAGTGVRNAKDKATIIMRDVFRAIQMALQE